MRTNRSGVTEVAHIRTNLEDYKENYDGIDWSLHRKKEEPIITASEQIDLDIDEAIQTLEDMKYLLSCISISPENDPKLKAIVKKYKL
jgi:hypothetical protein